MFVCATIICTSIKPLSINLVAICLTVRFSVTGIPALVVFDALSGEIVVTSDRARADVANACQFGPQAIENLVQSWINATSDETKVRL